MTTSLIPEVDSLRRVTLAEFDNRPVPSPRDEEGTEELVVRIIPEAENSMLHFCNDLGSFSPGRSSFNLHLIYFSQEMEFGRLNGAAWGHGMQLVTVRGWLGHYGRGAEKLLFSMIVAQGLAFVPGSVSAGVLNTYHLEGVSDVPH